MTHLLLEMENEREHWPSNEDLLDTLLKACHETKSTVLGHFSHYYQPFGYTGVVILGESHASVHTYEEHNKIYLDYFSCAIDPRPDVFEHVWEEAGFKTRSYQEIDR